MAFLKNEATDLIENKGSPSGEFWNEATARRQASELPGVDFQLRDGKLVAGKGGTFDLRPSTV